MNNEKFNHIEIIDITNDNFFYITKQHCCKNLSLNSSYSETFCFALPNLFYLSKINDHLIKSIIVNYSLDNTLEISFSFFSQVRKDFLFRINCSTIQDFFSKNTPNKNIINNLFLINDFFDEIIDIYKLYSPNNEYGAIKIIIFLICLLSTKNYDSLKYHSKLNISISGSINIFSFKDLHNDLISSVF